MEGLPLFTLVLMGVVWVIWVVAMFRMLWRLTKRSLARLEETGGGYFRWLGHSLAVFAEFFTLEEDRQERWRILLLTIAVFAMIGLHAWVVGGSS